MLIRSNLNLKFGRIKHFSIYTQNILKYFVTKRARVKKTTAACIIMEYQMMANELDFLHRIIMYRSQRELSGSSRSMWKPVWWLNNILITIRLDRPPFRSQRRILVAHYIRCVAKPSCSPFISTIYARLDVSIFRAFSICSIVVHFREGPYTMYNVEHHLTTMNQLHNKHTDTAP